MSVVCKTGGTLELQGRIENSDSGVKNVHQTQVESVICHDSKMSQGSVNMGFLDLLPNSGLQVSWFRLWQAFRV